MVLCGSISGVLFGKVVNINQALRIFIQFKVPAYVGGFLDIPHLRRGPNKYELQICLSGLDRY